MTKWFAALLASAGILAAVAPATAVASQAGGTKIFKDWMAACDNVAACSAFSFRGEDNDHAGYLMARREAGQDAPLRVTFVLRPVEGHRPRGEIVWSAVLDGEPMAGFERIAARIGDDGAMRAELSPAQSQAFVDAARNGDELVLRHRDHEAGRYSLVGITATLIWFDETQGRLGSTSAIIRKGARTASHPPVAPVIVRGPETSQAGLPKALPRAMTALPEIKACDVDYTNAEDLTVARLSPGTLLWAVPCTRGAYNTIFAMLLSDEAGGSIRRAVFPHTPGAGQDQTGELMNISYDPATRTLSNFDKARGIGDCGAASDWVWTGKAFELSAQIMMPDCRGVGPDDWPSVWKAEVR